MKIFKDWLMQIHDFECIMFISVCVVNKLYQNCKWANLWIDLDFSTSVDLQMVY